MKLLLLGTLGLLGMAGAARGQALRGGFMLASTFECNEFYYFSGDHFIHWGACDIGPYYGSGTLQLRADSLILRFTNWQEPAGIVSADLGFQSASLNSGLTVRVVDAVSGEPLAGAGVVSETTPAIGVSTDKSGLGQLTTPLPDGEYVTVSYVSYETARVKVGVGQSRHLLVKLRPPAKHHIKGNTRQAFSLQYSASGFPFLQNKYSRYNPATKKQTRYGLAEYHRMGD